MCTVQRPCGLSPITVKLDPDGVTLVIFAESGPAPPIHRIQPPNAGAAPVTSISPAMAPSCTGASKTNRPGMGDCALAIVAQAATPVAARDGTRSMMFSGYGADLPTAGRRTGFSGDSHG